MTGQSASPAASRSASAAWRVAPRSIGATLAITNKLDSTRTQTLTYHQLNRIATGKAAATAVAKRVGGWTLRTAARHSL